MAKDRDDRVELEGLVEEALPGTLFRVKIDSGQTILATLSGKLRINKVRILPKDRVKVEVTPYDPSRGRIIWRI